MKHLKLPPIHELVYLRGIENYTELNLANGEKILTSYTLLRYQEKLDGFLRVSRSHLLNPSYILKVEKYATEKEIEMKSGKRIKVSRRKRKIVSEFESQQPKNGH